MPIQHLCREHLSFLKSLGITTLEELTVAHETMNDPQIDVLYNISTSVDDIIASFQGL